MYTPPKFRVEDQEVICSFIEKHSFGLLLSSVDGVIHDTHTPFMYTEEGKLLGHIARANPQWKGWTDCNKVKIIFTGPHAYISPNYYVSEFAVPTWNYTAVSITGRISVINDEEEVLSFLDKLVATYESSGNPWVLDRNDERYMKLLSGIVVFSIVIDTVEASFKLNQNKSQEDQSKVIDSLVASGCPFNREVADLMSENL